MINRLKYSSTIFLLLFISTTLFAKPILNNSTDAYNYWSKRGIVEMVYASMQDYINTLDTLKNTKEKKIVNAYAIKYINEIDSKDIKEIENYYQSVKQFLRENKWDSTEVNLYQSLSEKQNKKSLLNEQFFSGNRTYKNNKYWNERQKNVLDNYKNDLQNIQKKSDKYNSKKENLTANFENEIKPNNLLNLVSILLCFLSGMLIGGFFIYQYSKLKIYSIISTDIYNYSESLDKYRGKYFFKYIIFVALLKENKDKKKSDNNKLNIMIKQLKNQIEESNKKYDGSDNQLIHNIKDVEFIEEETPKNVIEWNVESNGITNNNKTQTEIYFTIPENDGSFKTTNGKNVKGIDCFYKIELDKDVRKGKLHFISGDYDLRALDNIDYYLNPVCEIENISERKHSRKIKMVNPGTVLLSSDCWKIDIKNKVKIKLI